MKTSTESLTDSIPEADRYRVYPDSGISVKTDMHTVVKVMSSPRSGLALRDRMWLKVTIPHAFTGSDLVDWLLAHVDGFIDRREARKYASKLLKAGFIRHAVNKINFSEQCYYVFGNLEGQMNNQSIEDIHGCEKQRWSFISSSNTHPIGTSIGQPHPSRLQADILSIRPEDTNAFSVTTGFKTEVPPPSYSQVITQGTFCRFPLFTSPSGTIFTRTTSSIGKSYSDTSHQSKNEKCINTIDCSHETVRNSKTNIRKNSNSTNCDNCSTSDKITLEYATDVTSIGNEPISIESNVNIRQTHCTNEAESHQPELGRLGGTPTCISASRESFKMAMGNTSNDFFVDVI